MRAYTSVAQLFKSLERDGAVPCLVLQGEVVAGELRLVSAEVSPQELPFRPPESAPAFVLILAELPGGRMTLAFGGKQASLCAWVFDPVTGGYRSESV